MIFIKKRPQNAFVIYSTVEIDMNYVIYILFKLLQLIYKIMLK